MRTYIYVCLRCGNAYASNKENEPCPLCGSPGEVIDINEY